MKYQHTPFWTVTAAVVFACCVLFAQTTLAATPKTIAVLYFENNSVVDKDKLDPLKKGLADVLKREGYIWDWQEVAGDPSSHLRLDLKYGPNGERVIQNIRRISKPGRRVYSQARELKPILHGMGIRILSTSRGIVSDREARQKNLGGEVLCEVW